MLPDLCRKCFGEGVRVCPECHGEGIVYCYDCIEGVKHSHNNMGEEDE